jgi:hypothetical protein
MTIHRKSNRTSNQISGRIWPAGVILLATSVVTAGACGVHGSSTAPLPTSGAGGTDTVTGAAGSMTGAAGTTGSGGSGPGGDGGTAAGGGPGGGGTSGGGGTTGAGGVAGSGGTAGMPSGITINIGGNTVAKEDAIAFIHIGHSNMAGRGVDLPATRPYFFDTKDPHAWMYHSGKGFEPAVEPGTAGDGGNTLNGMVSGGPGTALVKEAAALAPSKYFISVGFAQSAAYCSQFLPGALYYNKLIAGPKELKGKVTFAGLMIYLGITERHGTQADIDNYPQCINKLVTQIRTDVGEPNLPMMINDYEVTTTGPLAVGTSFYNAIRPKEQMVPMVVSNSILIPADGILIQDDRATDDDHHFSLDGHKEYVRRMLQAMKDKGWFPWH